MARPFPLRYLLFLLFKPLPGTARFVVIGIRLRPMTAAENGTCRGMPCQRRATFPPVAHRRVRVTHVNNISPMGVGGRVALELYEGEGQAFITRTSSSPNAAKAIDRIIEFVHQEIG